MRISFDLDDTLICYDRNVPCEPKLAWWQQFFVHDEPLRLGARTLLPELQRRGWELWIYTTSYREPRLVRRWLWFHGIRVVDVINQTIHETRVLRTAREYPPSKNPRVFGIDMHVDDSVGVQMEGSQHGFAVVQLEPTDRAWTEKVLSATTAWERDVAAALKK